LPRLGSFTKHDARATRGVAWRGEAGGGGGARVKVSSSHALTSGRRDSLLRMSNSF